MTQTLGYPRLAYGKTLGEMRTALRFQLGNRQDVTDAQLDGWINDAYIEMAAEMRLKQLRIGLIYNSVAGLNAEQLPEGVASVVGVSLIDPDHPDGGYKLGKLADDAWDQLPESTGIPTKYHTYADHLAFWPTPDAAYRFGVDCYMNPMRLTLDNHSPIFDKGLHRALQVKARALAFDDLGQAEQEAVAQNSYVRHIRPKIDRAAQEEEDLVASFYVPRSQADIVRIARRRQGRDDDAVL